MSATKNVYSVDLKVVLQDCVKGIHASTPAGVKKEVNPVISERDYGELRDITWETSYYADSRDDEGTREACVEVSGYVTVEVAAITENNAEFAAIGNACELDYGMEDAKFLEITPVDVTYLRNANAPETT